MESSIAVGQSAGWRSPAVVGWLVLLALGLIVALEVGESRPDYVPARDIAVGNGPDGWVVRRVLPVGRAADAGLERGDRIVAVDGRPAAPSGAPPAWLERPADLTVRRGDQDVTIVTRAIKALAPVARVAYSLIGILFVLIGGFTWRRSGGGRVQAAFLALCGITGLSLAAVPAVWRGQAWAALLLYGGATAGLTGLYAFVRLFPYVRPIRVGRRRVAPEWLWVVPGLVTLIYLAAMLDLAPDAVEQIAPFRGLWHLVLLVAMVIAVGQSWWQARRMRDRRALAQMTIVGGGAILGFLPLLVILGLNAVANTTVVQPVIVVPAIVLLPVAVAYAMLRYRVMDVDLVVRRGVVFGVALLVYALAMIVVLEMVNTFDPASMRPARDAITIGAALGLIPLLNRLIRHLDRAVYGRDQDPRQTLAAAARSLASTLDEQQILALALAHIQRTLQPALVILYEYGEAQEYRPLAWQRRHEALSVAPAPDPIPGEHAATINLTTGQSWQVGGTLLRGDGQAPETDPGRPALLVPAGPTLDGVRPPWVLGLSTRPSDLPYSHEDIALLEALAQGMAAALANARHYGRLQSAYATLRQTQLQLLQAAKLAAVGEVASGITHELNQPLMVLRARLQQLMVQVDEPVRAKLVRLEKQTQKMERIIDHLRSFSRQSVDERRPVALATIVDETVMLLGEQLRARGIELVVDAARPLPPVLADAGQLEQVLINLLSNARDALVDRPSPQITISTRIPERSPAMAALCVADTGVGIPPETLAHIFDAFFTTKPDGQGTGLGLSISRGIIERHGGHIEVESAPEVGTTFRILLPLARAESSEATGRDATGRDATGRNESVA